jgi:S1-C subfamily serine protease
LKSRGIWALSANSICYIYHAYDAGAGFKYGPISETCHHVYLSEKGVEFVDITGSWKSVVTKVENESFEYDFASGFAFEENDIRSVRNYTGTGFLVSPDGYVVTNRHVVDDCKTIIGDLRGYAMSLDLLAKSERVDLALLKSRTPAENVYQLRLSEPRLGEKVLVAGFPLSGLLAQDLKITSGEVSGTRAKEPVIQISAPVQPGSSGSPVYDSSGAVIGVVFSQLDTEFYAQQVGGVPQNVNFALSNSAVFDFLVSQGLRGHRREGGGELRGEEIAAIAEKSSVKLTCQSH